MIVIEPPNQNTLCGECGQPRRECRCFAAGQRQHENRWQAVKNQLDALARQHPEVLGDAFTSNATGQRRQVLLAVRRRYFAALRELVEIWACADPKLRVQTRGIS